MISKNRFWKKKLEISFSVFVENSLFLSTFFDKKWIFQCLIHAFSLFFFIGVFLFSFFVLLFLNFKFVECLLLSFFFFFGFRSAFCQTNCLWSQNREKEEIIWVFFKIEIWNELNWNWIERKTRKCWTRYEWFEFEVECFCFEFQKIEGNNWV